MTIEKSTTERLFSEQANKSDNPITKDKFSINLLKYPSDLGSEELKHYVEFQITVRGKSKFNKNNRLFKVKRNPDTSGFTEKDLKTVAEVGTFIETGAIAHSITKKVFNIFSKNGGNTFKSSGLENIAAAAVGVGAGILAKESLSANKILKPDTSYRISDVISLFVSQPPVVSYNMNYSNKELGTLAGVMSGSVLDSQTMMEGGVEAATAIGTALAKLPGIFGATNVQAVLGASSKTALNPFKEVIFESVDFRSFNFKYRFMPRSKKESEDVYRIIKLFKFHQHPELSAGKLFFVYPAEFNIAYYYGDNENKYFHKFAPCVLSNMDVSYGEGGFSSFVDGNPTEVLLSLTFREAEILTKTQIDQGC